MMGSSESDGRSSARPERRGRALPRRGRDGRRDRRGSNRPPASVAAPSGRLSLSSDGKTIWMTEWGECWRTTMGHLSKVLGIPIHSGSLAQQAARRLATREVFLLYETTPETLAAKDGCRNGILWRYYHAG